MGGTRWRTRRRAGCRCLPGRTTRRPALSIVGTRPTKPHPQGRRESCRVGPAYGPIRLRRTRGRAGLEHRWGLDTRPTVPAILARTTHRARWVRLPPTIHPRLAPVSRCLRVSGQGCGLVSTCPISPAIPTRCRACPVSVRPSGLLIRWRTAIARLVCPVSTCPPCPGNRHPRATVGPTFPAGIRLPLRGAPDSTCPMAGARQRDLASTCPGPAVRRPRRTVRPARPVSICPDRGITPPSPRPTIGRCGLASPCPAPTVRSCPAKQIRRTVTSLSAHRAGPALMRPARRWGGPVPTLVRRDSPVPMLLVRRGRVLTRRSR